MTRNGPRVGVTTISAAPVVPRAEKSQIKQRSRTPALDKKRAGRRFERSRNLETNLRQNAVTVDTRDMGIALGAIAVVGSQRRQVNSMKGIGLRVGHPL